MTVSILMIDATFTTSTLILITSRITTPVSMAGLNITKNTMRVPAVNIAIAMHKTIEHIETTHGTNYSHGGHD